MRELYYTESTTCRVCCSPGDTADAASDRNSQSAPKFALLDKNIVTETPGAAGAVIVVNSVSSVFTGYI